jgi:uncharacterized protein YjbJ (UPF0337 family)
MTRQRCVARASWANVDEEAETKNLPNRDGVKMGKKDKAKNLAQIGQGKLKEAAGKTTGDQQLESEGDLDQMKGNVKQAGEKVKDAFK